MSADKPFNDIPDPFEHKRDAIAATLSQAEARAPSERAPTRATRRAHFAAALIVTLVSTTFVVRYWGFRPDIASVYVVLPLALWIAAVGFSLISLLKPDARGLVRNIRVIWAIVLGLPLLFAVSAGWADKSGEPFPFVWDTAFPCVKWAGIAGIGPIVAAILLFRRSFISAPVWRGAAAGAAVGLSAGLTVHSVCPHTDPTHVLVTHGLPILIGALLGAGLGALGGRT